MKLGLLLISGLIIMQYNNIYVWTLFWGVSWTLSSSASSIESREAILPDVLKE